MRGALVNVHVCQICSEDLKVSNNPPKFSLANGMWLGRVPCCIQVLTFPEQLLLARIFPCVYVFKLFSKWDVGMIQSPCNEL